MVFANKYYMRDVYRWILCGLAILFIYSCAEIETSDKKKPGRPAAESINFEARNSLLQWHDETYKSYYGLKGLVEHLDIYPVHTIGGDVATDGWRLWFNRQGRLTRKQRMAVESEPEFETVYEYQRDGQSLKRIVSNLNGKSWRSSDYVYKADVLIRVDYADQTTNDRFRVKRSRQLVNNGWFEIQSPVEKIEMPRYSEFNTVGELVWSNKGDINNGLGEQYFIRTVDNVTSSSVVNQNTEDMTGRGGYRYRYRDNGLLMSVESYNAHNNRLFHVTEYKYDDLWLLVEENRQVKDSSVFNQVIQEHVSYDYREIDSHGNWLLRILNYSSRHQKQSYEERRKITYFNEVANK
ncbi:hypothetical protein [Kaarinaea lacus]